MLIVAACGSGGSSPSSPAPAASPPAADSVSPTAQRIELKLAAALKMEPAEVTVKAGLPLTFVVTNTRAIQHEFFLGDEAAQDEREQEMRSAGGMTMDEADGVVVKAGETEELTHTFMTAGTSIAAITKPGTHRRHEGQRRADRVALSAASPHPMVELAGEEGFEPSIP